MLIKTANKIKNKGTGAGGKNTNKNGLSFEKLTDLKTEYKVISNNKHHNVIQFHNQNKKLIESSQSNFYKYMNIDKNKQNIGHGCKKPDECYIHKVSKNIFIIEKKFQQCSGSVCEKIQTAPFKIWNYKRNFPKYDINYIYVLSEWFENNCKNELEYLDENKIKYFTISKTYKTEIIKYIMNKIDN